MSPIVLTGSFFFDGSDPLYKGHFPGNPVVPGSLVVASFLSMLKGEGHTPSEVKNFRFRLFLPPGSYPWAVTIEGDRAVCRLLLGDRPAVTGEVVL